MNIEKEYANKQKQAIQHLRMLSEGQSMRDWNQLEEINCANVKPRVEMIKSERKIERKLLTQNQNGSIINSTAVRFKRRSQRKSCNIISQKINEDLSVVSLNKQRIMLGRGKQFKKEQFKNNMKRKSNLMSSVRNPPTNRVSIGEQIQSKMNTESSDLKIMRIINQINNTPLTAKQKLKICLDTYKEQKQKQKSKQISEVIKFKLRKKQNQLNYAGLKSEEEKSKQKKESITFENIVQSSLEKSQFLKFHLCYEGVKEPKVIKNWFQSQRHRKKRSVASLLRQRYQVKSQQKDKPSSINTAIQSARLMSLVALRQKDII